MATITADRSEQITSRTDPWRIAWNSLAGDAMLAIILLVMALIMALARGAWLPQSPDSTTDPIAFSRWRSETQAHFGNAFTPLRELGLFSLEQSTVLRGLVALSALCLLVRLIDNSLSMWHARRSSPPPEFMEAQTATQVVLQDVATALQKKRFRVVLNGDGLYADRFPLAKLGQPVIYLGALIVIVSLAFSSLAGWRTGNLTLGVGQMLPVSGQRGLPRSASLRLDALDAERRGQVTLLRETEMAGTGNVSQGHSIELAGLTILLDQVGPAVRASAVLTDGQVVPLQAAAALAPSPELLLLLTQEEPDRFFAAPKADLVVRLARGVNTPDSIRAQVYRSRTGAVLFDDTLPSSGQLSVENVNLHLSQESYAVLSAAHDPSRWMTLAGIVILALGLMLAAWMPAAQLWVVSNENGTQLGGDHATIRAIAPEAVPTSQYRRKLHTISSIGWKTGFAILCSLAGIAVISNLARGLPVWAAGPTASAILAPWLAGCAAAVWSRRAIRWLALALLVTVLAAALWQPGFTLVPGL